MARSACPDFTFEINDGIKKINSLEAEEYPVIICTEVLEHIEDDLQLIAGIPKGTCFIGSVPNFEAAGHVRIFGRQKQVNDRYEKYFSSFTIREIALHCDSKIYLFDGIRD